MDDLKDRRTTPPTTHPTARRKKPPTAGRKKHKLPELPKHKRPAPNPYIKSYHEAVAEKRALLCTGESKLSSAIKRDDFVTVVFYIEAMLEVDVIRLGAEVKAKSIKSDPPLDETIEVILNLAMRSGAVLTLGLLSNYGVDFEKHIIAFLEKISERTPRKQRPRLSRDRAKTLLHAIHTNTSYLLVKQELILWERQPRKCLEERYRPLFLNVKATEYAQEKATQDYLDFLTGKREGLARFWTLCATLEKYADYSTATSEEKMNSARSLLEKTAHHRAPKIEWMLIQFILKNHSVDAVDTLLKSYPYTQISRPDDLSDEGYRKFKSFIHDSKSNNLLLKIGLEQFVFNKGNATHKTNVAKRLVPIIASIIAFETSSRSHFHLDLETYETSSRSHFHLDWHYYLLEKNSFKQQYLEMQGSWLRFLAVTPIHTALITTPILIQMPPNPNFFSKIELPEVLGYLEQFLNIVFKHGDESDKSTCMQYLNFLAVNLLRRFDAQYWKKPDPGIFKQMRHLLFSVFKERNQDPQVLKVLAVFWQITDYLESFTTAELQEDINNLARHIKDTPPLKTTFQALIIEVVQKSLALSYKAIWFRLQLEKEAMQCAEEKLPGAEIQIYKQLIAQDRYAVSRLSVARRTYEDLLESFTALISSNPLALKIELTLKIIELYLSALESHFSSTGIGSAVLGIFNRYLVLHAQETVIPKRAVPESSYWQLSDSITECFPSPTDEATSVHLPLTESTTTEIKADKPSTVTTLITRKRDFYHKNWPRYQDSGNTATRNYYQATVIMNLPSLPPLRQLMHRTWVSKGNQRSNLIYIRFFFEDESLSPKQRREALAKFTLRDAWSKNPWQALLPSDADFGVATEAERAVLEKEAREQKIAQAYKAKSLLHRVFHELIIALQERITALDGDEAKEEQTALVTTSASSSSSALVPVASSAAAAAAPSESEEDKAARTRREKEIAELKAAMPAEFVAKALNILPETKADAVEYDIRTRQLAWQFFITLQALYEKINALTRDHQLVIDEMTNTGTGKAAREQLFHLCDLISECQYLFVDNYEIDKPEELILFFKEVQAALNRQTTTLLSEEKGALPERTKTGLREAEDWFVGLRARFRPRFSRVLAEVKDPEMKGFTRGVCDELGRLWIAGGAVGSGFVKFYDKDAEKRKEVRELVEGFADLVPFFDKAAKFVGLSYKICTFIKKSGEVLGKAAKGLSYAMKRGDFCLWSRQKIAEHFGELNPEQQVTRFYDNFGGQGQAEIKKVADTLYRRYEIQIKWCYKQGHLEDFTESVVDHLKFFFQRIPLKSLGRHFRSKIEEISVLWCRYGAFESTAQIAPKEDKAPSGGKPPKKQKPVRIVSLLQAARIKFSVKKPTGAVEQVMMRTSLKRKFEEPQPMEIDNNYLNSSPVEAAALHELLNPPPTDSPLAIEDKESSPMAAIEAAPAAGALVERKKRLPAHLALDANPLYAPIPMPTEHDSVAKLLNIRLHFSPTEVKAEGLQPRFEITSLLEFWQPLEEEVREIRGHIKELQKESVVLKEKVLHAESEREEMRGEMMAAKAERDEARSEINVLKKHQATLVKRIDKIEGLASR